MVPHVFPNFPWTRWATVPLVRLGLSQLAPRQRRDSKILCFPIPDVSSPLRQTLTVPSAPQRCPESGSISCDALAPDTLSQRHHSLGSFTTWLQLTPFGLQRLIRVGRQHSLPDDRPPGLHGIAAREGVQCECAGTLPRCPQPSTGMGRASQHLHPDNSAAPPPT